jgi:hypothetical protein
MAKSAKWRRNGIAKVRLAKAKLKIKSNANSISAGNALQLLMATIGIFNISTSGVMANGMA